MLKILDELQAENIRVFLQDGRLKVEANAGALTDELAGKIFEQKSNIVSFLKESQTAKLQTLLSNNPGLSEQFEYEVNERAAIMTFDGNVDQGEAERTARRTTTQIWVEIFADSDEIIPANEQPIEFDVVAIYADGGVIKKNPSEIGGTWAWCGVDKNGKRIIENSGAIPAPEGGTITNNHTEQLAITLALEAMPDGWSGTVYSDSQIALGRVFKGWQENNLPRDVSERSKAAVRRLGKIKHVLLQGHPTKADLENGFGKKRGFPVSIHNVWCDKACGEAAKSFIDSKLN